MFKTKHLFVIAFVATLFAGSLQAQDKTSPYSRYGYGILRDQITGVSKGMGGASYGIRNSYSANVANPASYSRVDSLTFLFDVGLYFNSGKLNDPSGSKSDYNGGLDYITLLFPVAKNLGVSAGILPYSSVGYKYGSLEKDGGVQYQTHFNGSGGISQVYVGAGYEVPFLKGLSLGANASYLFGKLKHNRSIMYSNTLHDNSASNTEFRISQIKVDLGVQYEFDLDAKNHIVLGATLSPKINSKSDFDEYKLKYTGSNLTKIDTVHVSNAASGIPHTLGVGASWSYNNRWLVAGDVTYEHWKGVNFASNLNDGLNKSNRFNNRWRYNVGGEYVNNPYDMNFFKRVRIRGGANYSNSYMNVKNVAGQVKGYNEYGVTFGFGIPLFDPDSFGKRTSYLNINFDYKRLSPDVKNMIRENYYGVTVSVNLNELWFYQRKIH